MLAEKIASEILTASGSVSTSDLFGVGGRVLSLFRNRAVQDDCTVQ